MGSLNLKYEPRDVIPFSQATQQPQEASRKLKICITSRAPYIGGAEMAAERLAIGLREQGHEVFFLLGKRGEVMERYESSGFRCHYFPVIYTSMRRFWRYFAARTSLRSLFKREQVDVLHANDLPSAQVFFDAARTMNITRICHHRFLYDGNAIEWFNKFGAEKHIFVSRALMGDLCERSTTLAESARAVVYDGLSMPAKSLHADRMTAKVELGLSTDQPMVLIAGQVIERKGVADLLHAWSHLKKQGKDRAELVVVGDDLAGDGAYRRDMQQLANRLGISPKFVGFQKNVDRWLMASDIAVVPSHVEPLGNATLEAMSHGVPVIGANVGGIPEMIISEETGVLVPAKDPRNLAGAIDRLISDADLRVSLGAAARIRCETLFSLRAHANAMLHHYATATKNSALRKAA